MERWWNVRVELLVPFGTEEEARSTAEDPRMERIKVLCHDLFGGCHEVMTTTIEEATDED